MKIKKNGNAKKLSITATVILSGILLITKRTAVADAILNGLSVCGEIIIPSLFPFMTLSSFAVKSGISDTLSRIVSPVMQKIFRLPGNCFTPVFFGFIGGYPTGAVNISELYKNKKISRTDAKHMLSFCVNAGPAFIVTAAGEMTLGSSAAGIVMLVSVCIASLLTGISFSLLKKNSQTGNTDSFGPVELSSSLVESAYSSSKGIISVCTWVLLFSAFSGIVRSFIKNETLLLVFGAFSEITTGISAAAELGGIPLVSAAISFGGICVMMQLLPIIKKCDIKVHEYLEFRILNSVLSFITAKIILLFVNIPVSAVADTQSKLWSRTAPASVMLIIMGCILIADITSGRSGKISFSDITG